MRITMFLATLMLGSALLASAQNPQDNPQQQPQAQQPQQQQPETQPQAQQPQSDASRSPDTLTGCLKGSKTQYSLVEDNGHRHKLMTSQDLTSYVGHKVTVNGQQSREAGTNSDTEGHRAGFFKVDSVNDEGECKAKK